MAKTTTVRARIEPALKREVENVLSKLGLTSSEAITVFFRQVMLHGGLPFPVKMPNAETERAMRSARAGRGVKSYKDVKEWAKAARSAR